jgi:hypothetical protein
LITILITSHATLRFGVVVSLIPVKGVAAWGIAGHGRRVPACEQPAAAEPYVVVGHAPRHCFPGEWAAHGLPRGPCLTPELNCHQTAQRPLLVTNNRHEQRRVGLLERLLERLCVQRRIEVKVEVKVEVEIPAKTRVPTRVLTPVATQSGIRSDEHRGILRATQSRFDFGFRAVVHLPIDEFRVPSDEFRVTDSECRVPVSGGGSFRRRPS